MRSHYFTGLPRHSFPVLMGANWNLKLNPLLTTNGARTASFSLSLSLSLSRRKHRFRPKSEWPNNKLPFNDVKNTRRCHGDHIGGRERERERHAILFTPFNGVWRRRRRSQHSQRSSRMSWRIKRDFHRDRGGKERGCADCAPLLEVKVPGAIVISVQLGNL